MCKQIIVLIMLASAHNLLLAQNRKQDSLLQIVALNKQDDEHMKALALLAIDCFRADPNKAKMYMFRNLQLAVPAENYYRQAGAYSLLLSIYQEEGLADSTLWCLNNLKSVSEKAPDDKKLQSNYNQATGLYHKKRGDFKTALPYLLVAAKYTEESGASKADAGGHWLNAGNVYNDMGDYNNAMTCHLKALRLFEEAGHRLGESFCYNSIALSYYKLKLFPKAVDYAKKSLALKKILKDRKGVCVSELLLAEIYRNMGNTELALRGFDAAIQLAKEEKMIREEGDCYFNMGKIFAAQKKDSIAIIHFQRSKAIAVQLDNKQIVVDADAELTVLYRNVADHKQTETALEKSLNTAKESGGREDEAYNYKRLSEFYTSTKQYEKALDYITKHHAVKDSISGIAVQVQLKKLEEQYNTSKKEQEIALLKKDQLIQQQTLARQRIFMFGSVALALLALGGIWLLVSRHKLKQRMRELELRNQIAADLHDEVGSSLSSIHLLSQMAAHPHEGLSQKNIIEKMSVNAKETMDKMSDLVWTIKPEEVEDMKQRMERFAYEICGAKNIDIDLELSRLDTKMLTMEQRKNLYLIFKEALNNSVKYSGTDKIFVSAYNEKNMLTMVVKDEGSGFDLNSIKKGNGIHNIQSRAKAMDGHLQINSNTGAGTEIKLQIVI